MAKRKCRDCTRCTESMMQGCLVAPFRLWVDIARMLLIWPFRKMCPECGHPLAWHLRDSTGRFHD